MDQMPTPHRPRPRRRSPWRRLRRALGLDRRHGVLRLALLAAGIVAATAALLVALGPDDAGVVAAGSFAPPAVSAGPVHTSGPTPASSLPPIATPTPAPSVSAAPEGVVARRIRIDRLGIDLRIVEGDGIDAPMRKAAHYPGSGWPGGGTNIYLYGHAQEGMFLPLWDARVGDVVVLELVDGSEARYSVTEVLPKVPWNALRYTQPTPDERLSLQTSTSYTATAPRFLVIAEPAP